MCMQSDRRRRGAIKPLRSGNQHSPLRMSQQRRIFSWQNSITRNEFCDEKVEAIGQPPNL